jgi:3-oxoacyl-[acyl-carrier protein] reductase
MRECAWSVDTLDGRVALVTGGSGGIGAAICRQLAAGGVRVGVGYGSNREAADQLAREINGVALGADMEDREAPRQLVADTEAALGPLDLLVANHGLARPAAYPDVDAAMFDRTLAVNLRAPFLLAQAALEGMRERGYGRILFISSAAAFRGGVVGTRLRGLESRAARLGLLPLEPGGRRRRHRQRAGARIHRDRDAARRPEPAGQRSARRRVGRPEEVADLALAILRNAYVTNHVFTIDGGMHPR